MRTLNRPMFNMGGPIKEGVMHGIREPRQRYADQGLVKQITEQILKKPFSSAATAAGTGATAKIAADAAKKASMFQKAGSLFSKRLPTDVQIGRGIKKGWRGFLKRIPTKGLAFTNPLTVGIPSALIAKATYTKPEQVEKEYGISKLEKVLAGSLPGTGGEYLPLAVRRILGERKIEVPEDRLKNITMEKGPPGGTQLPSYTDPDKANKLAQAAKDRRVNELLEMMGHKQSKKDAVYDALIDASQIVGAAPGGKTMDITKDIITPVIAATSKRFDKPKEIEEAIRLMTVKGEIEKDIAKDIAAGKGGPLKQNAKDLVAAGVFKTETAAMKHLASKKTIGNIVADVSKQYGVSGANTDVLDTSVRIKEDIIPKGKWKGDNKVYKEWKNDNKDKADIELEFVKTITDRKAGDYYIVDKRIVLVDENLNPDYYY